jgi:hypothetical protein
MSPESKKVDLLLLLSDLDGNTSNLKLNARVFRARAAVKRLIEACEPFVRHNSSEETFEVTHLSSANVANLRAALADILGGA